MTTRARAKSIESEEEQSSRIETAKKVYVLFLANADLLGFDGAVMENGKFKVSTAKRATLTSDSVVCAARAVMERKKQDAIAKAKRAAEKEQFRIDKAAKVARNIAESIQREEESLQSMKKKRAVRFRAATIIRSERRATSEGEKLSNSQQNLSRNLIQFLIDIRFWPMVNYFCHQPRFACNCQLQ